MKMGFENMRFRKHYNNRPETVTIGGKTINVRSQGEKKVAEYLEVLKQSGHIWEWAYEARTFRFPDDSWLIDFTVQENIGSFYHIEFKGHFEARDRRKLKLLFKYYPDARVLYVFQNRCDIRKMKNGGKISVVAKASLLGRFDKGDYLMKEQKMDCCDNIALELVKKLKTKTNKEIALLVINHIQSQFGLLSPQYELLDAVINRLAPELDLDEEIENERIKK